jgi:hypothetical protein
MDPYDPLSELLRVGQRRGAIRTDADRLALAETLTGIPHLVITDWLTGWWGKHDDLSARLGLATEVLLDGCRSHARR